jgi:hypothetical protein
MKSSLPGNASLSLALLLHAGLVSAEQPFSTREMERRPDVAGCRIFEFTCATCGHIIDSEQWDAQNRLISDVEACAKQQAERVANKAPPKD